MRRSHNHMTRRGALGALALLGVSGRGSASFAQPEKSKAPRVEKPPPAAQQEEGKAPWLMLPPTPTLPATNRAGHAKINGENIFFAQFGEGPPVLFLHGGLASSNYWGHQVERMARDFTVIVMDTRGHGRSPVTSTKFSYAAFADDVISLLDELKIPSTTIVGWSDGAITGLQLAITRPERVTKLFAFGANSSLDGLKTDGAKSPVFKRYVERCRAEYAALSPQPQKWRDLLAGLRPMWRSEPSFSPSQLGQITAQTAISDGEHDEIIKLEHTTKLSKAIPGARLMIQPRVSHFAMLQNPSQFTDYLLDFVTEK
jgi:pimeloyl-ACP methyl ester carboxylesterase